MNIFQIEVSWLILEAHSQQQLQLPGQGISSRALTVSIQTKVSWLILEAHSQKQLQLPGPGIYSRALTISTVRE